MTTDPPTVDEIIQPEPNLDATRRDFDIQVVEPIRRPRRGPTVEPLPPPYPPDVPVDPRHPPQMPAGRIDTPKVWPTGKVSP